MAPRTVPMVLRGERTPGRDTGPLTTHSNAALQGAVCMKQLQRFSVGFVLGKTVMKILV